MKAYLRGKMAEKQVQIMTIHYKDDCNIELYETVDISTVRALEEIWFDVFLGEYEELT